MCYWLLKECQNQKIEIPYGYELSKMIANEGFRLKYSKPTDLLHGKDPPGDVTICCDFIPGMNISFMF